MKLFESSWKDNYDYYERYYDTNLKKSMQSKITLPQEWYEESSQGDYTSILDDNIKLVRKQGSSKEARNHYGFIGPIYRNIRDNYWKDSNYNKTPRTWVLDIETRVGQNSKGFPTPSKAKEEIVLMQIYDSELKTMIVIGSREWKHEKSYKFNYKVQYIQTKDEIELLETYIKVFKKLNPLIIYAWNGNGFDFPYIYNRLKLLGMDTNALSNYADCKLKEREFQGKFMYSLIAAGCYYIDMLDVYKKFVFKPRASYGLDFIADAELGKKKVDHSEYAKFDDFYSGNYTIPQNPTENQKNSEIYKQAILGNTDEVKELAYSDFVYYGCEDSILPKELDDKLNFTSLLFMISEKMGVLVSDAMGTVKPWSQYISNRSHTNKQCVPPMKSTDEAASIVGGHVRTPQAGKHKWILSADVNSMYPLLGMVGFNMSPETYLSKHQLPQELRDIVLKYFNDENEQDRLDMDPKVWEKTEQLLKQYKLSLGINGAVFENSKVGVVPDMIQEIYKSRKQAKKTMFKYEKQGIIIKEILKDRK